MSDMSDTFQEKAAEGSLVPTVVEGAANSGRAFDLFSKLLRDRIIFLTGPVNEPMATIAIAQLLFLQSENPTKPIDIYINSPGGDVDSGMAIYDTIQHLKNSGIQINTIAMGRAMSMGSVLLVAGSEGCRSALPSANIMIHQPSGGAQGKSTEIANTAREIEHIRKRMAYLYEAHTKMSYETALQRIQTDYFMRAEEAKGLGIIDEVAYPENFSKIANAMREANLAHASERPSNDNPQGWHKPAANGPS